MSNPDQGKILEEFESCLPISIRCTDTNSEAQNQKSIFIKALLAKEGLRTETLTMSDFKM